MSAAEEEVLAAWLGNPAVTEILVNGPQEIWVEEEGRLRLTGAAFAGEEALRQYTRRLVGAAGRQIDFLHPFVDCSLADGTRLHVAGPPVSRRGFCLSFRKFRAEPWSLDQLAAAGAVSRRAEDYLRACVRNRRNVFFAGGTGTGKTTFLSALLGEADPGERLVALEDVAEIRVRHPHFLSLEARPANQEGEGALPLRRLLREALRMRPDRILFGECRGDEALDLLLALNSGHPGSMGTVHASSAREALQRLEALALLGAANISEGALKSLIPGAVHVIVQLERKDGRRGIAAIVEVKGVDEGRYLLREVPL